MLIWRYHMAKILGQISNIHECVEANDLKYLKYFKYKFCSPCEAVLRLQLWTFVYSPSYYRVQQRYFEEINENECAYLYDDADRILNMNNIDFDMDDVRIGNPRDIEIDDWDVRMFTIIQFCWQYRQYTCLM